MAAPISPGTKVTDTQKICLESHLENVLENVMEIVMGESLLVDYLGMTAFQHKVNCLHSQVQIFHIISFS